MDDNLPSQRWPRLAIILAIVAAVVLTLQGAQAAKDILAPLFLTINLFIAAWPVREMLLNRGAPRIVGTVALCLVVFLILIVFFVSLGWGISALVRELPSYSEEFENIYNQGVTLLASFGITEDQLFSQLRQLNPANFTGIVQGALSQVSSLVSVIGVIVIMMFMMVMDSGTFHSRNVALQKFQPHVAAALNDFVVGVRRYWIVTTIFGLIVAVLDVGILLFLGVPLAFVWGLIAFITNYVPNVGFVIGIVPPVLMALLAQGWTAALIVTALYCVVNFVIQSIIQPKFNGDAVGVTATVSFLSLMLWGAILGPLGALLALPATLLCKAVLVDHDQDVRWLNAFIASRTETTNPGDAGEPQVEDVELDDAGAAGAHRALATD